MRRRIIQLCSAALLVGGILSSQVRPPRLLKDIAPGKGVPRSSDPVGKALLGPSSWGEEFPCLGGVFFFTADDGVHGREIWSGLPYPGTARLAVDLAPGRASGVERDAGITSYKGRIYFWGTAGPGKTGLWRTDGSPAGTILCWKDSFFYPGKGFYGAFQAGGKLYFFTKTGNSPGTYTLYAYDGSLNPPRPLLSSCRYVWGRPAVSGGKVFFVMSTDSTGSDFWVTDGTKAGTGKLFTVPWEFSGGFTYPVSLGGWVYFPYRNLNWSGIVKTDGKSVVKVTGIYLQWGWWSPVPLGRKIVFGGPGSSGYEKGDPWVLDTVTGRISPLKIIAPSGQTGYTRGVLLGKRILFPANEGSPSRWALWSTDGTTSGTFKVTPFRKGAYGWYKTAVSGNKVFFEWTDPGTGNELWVTDGTAGGTKLLKDIYPGTGSSSPACLTSLGGGRVAFSAKSPAEGVEPWVSDGTARGTKLLEDVKKGFFGYSSDPAVPVGFFGRLYFRADDLKNGKGLWASDGTSGGTFYFQGTLPEYGISLADKFIYACKTKSGWPLFLVSDGTSRGTTAFSLSVGMGQGFRAVADRWALFDGFSQGRGYEPWVTDGTKAGTRRLKDLGASPGGGEIGWTASTGRKVFFTRMGISGVNLWVTDGTAAGTRLLAKGLKKAENLAAFGDKLLFQGMKQVSYHGAEPWISDGTPGGTYELLDLAPGSNSGLFLGGVAVGKVVFFLGRDGRTVTSGKVGLFRTDGTAAGTRRVGSVEFLPGVYRSLALGRTRALFWVDDGIHGLEPWVTDGTGAGTCLLADLVPGPGSSYPYRVVPLGTRRVAVLYGGARSPEGILVTAGTKASNFRIDPARLGFGGKLGDFLAFAGGTLYFSADDGIHGLEPWAWTAGATVERVGWGTGTLSLDGTDPVLGGRTVLTVAGLGPSRKGILLFGNPTAAPIRLGKGAGLFVDPFRSPFQAALAGKGGTYSLNLPADPWLLGLRLGVQALAGPGGSGPLGLDFTNGLVFSLGY